MAKNIEPSLKKIGVYLKLEGTVVFTIPEYQRPYSWGIDHCDKLWQDIDGFAASESKDRYFFGTIIMNCQDNDTKFALIDGQQRTTTFLLLLKALLLKINIAIGKTAGDEDSASLYRGLQDRRREIMEILYKFDKDDIPYNPDNRDKEICNAVAILENNSINERYKKDLHAILQSVDYEEAESKVEKIPRKQKDNRYTNFFRNFKYFYEKAGTLPESQLNKIAKVFIDGCEVIEIKSWQVEQAITMFNSLNSDGLPLYDSDIISAKLYAKAEEQGTVEQFSNLWKELLEIIKELKESGIGDMDSILMQQMYYTRTVNKETVNDIGSINVTTPGLRRYFTEINKDLIRNPIQLCEGMINLSKIWLKISSYPIAQVLFKFNENAKLFLASYFYRFKESTITETKVKTVLECVLRLFSVLEVVDTGYSSKKFKTFLFGEEVKFANPNVGVREIKADFDKHINGAWNRDAIKQEIMDYDKHTLVYLNEFLFAKKHGINFVIGEKCDIEHIMPYSGKNQSEIRKDAGIKDEEEFKEFVNKLGNKILLEEKINRSIGNDWFRTKVSTHLGNKTGYIDSQYPIANDLVSRYQDKKKPISWKKKDITQATNEAADRIVEFIFGK